MHAYVRWLWHDPCMQLGREVGCACEHVLRCGVQRVACRVVGVGVGVGVCARASLRLDHPETLLGSGLAPAWAKNANLARSYPFPFPFPFARTFMLARCHRVVPVRSGKPVLLGFLGRLFRFLFRLCDSQFGPGWKRRHQPLRYRRDFNGAADDTDLEGTVQRCDGDSHGVCRRHGAGRCSPAPPNKMLDRSAVATQDHIRRCEAFRHDPDRCPAVCQGVESDVVYVANNAQPLPHELLTPRRYGYLLHGVAPHHCNQV